MPHGPYRLAEVSYAAHADTVCLDTALSVVLGGSFAG